MENTFCQSVETRRHIKFFFWNISQIKLTEAFKGRFREYTLSPESIPDTEKAQKDVLGYLATSPSCCKQWHVKTSHHKM